MQVPPREGGHPKVISPLAQPHWTPPKSSARSLVMDQNFISLAPIVASGNTSSRGSSSGHPSRPRSQGTQDEARA